MQTPLRSSLLFLVPLMLLVHAASAEAQASPGLAGFRFGWTAAEAHEACERAGHSYSIERVGEQLAWV